jgi:hypothetical protein
MLQLDRAARILGSTFVDRLTSKKHAVLTIGNESFTRHQLVTQVGTGNFRAATILSEVAANLKVSSVKDLYAFSPYELAALHGLGTTTIFVLMSLFESKGLDAMKWCGLQSPASAKKVVSFVTVKHRLQRKDQVAAKEAQLTIKRKAAINLSAEAGAIVKRGANGATLRRPAAPPPA